MVLLNNIGKVYGKNEYKQNVLQNISLHIKKGDMVSIMGPSGSGKSSLLNIMGLLDEKHTGEYYIDGISTSELNEKERALVRNQKIGFVFQSFHLLKELTAVENVQMGLVLANVYKPAGKKIKKGEMKRRSEEILEQVGLKAHMHKKAFQLSGGQQQRVAIARALINNPSVIFADEPTGALDQKNGTEIMGLLKNLNEQGKTIVIVTHDQKVASYCGTKINMLDGNIV